MLLLIDAGNTRIKWAIPQAAQSGNAAPQWQVLDSVSHQELPQLEALWAAQQISRVLISNVAGDALQASLVAILQRAAPGIVVERFQSSGACAGLRNGYRQPAQLGSDRFASAIAAHTLYPQRALIVATCGTATTIDAVSPDGIFLGGMILPGLQLMAQSLAKNTAQLPSVAASLSLQYLFADNTELAIVSGCIHAQVGAIMQAHEALHASQEQAVDCIISGGAASYLTPHLGISCHHVDNLVLIGLAVVSAATLPSTHSL
ncbi:type III pantothenate kinase [Undibacterium sp.]|uniref:type III pantothenate kinase n=1 Tax=Undibacterium sp. TaxID=1914977 RepID=UPI0025E30CCF|nr:type III pantothenate kinase [Undibacterium sp.]